MATRTSDEKQRDLDALPKRATLYLPPSSLQNWCSGLKRVDTLIGLFGLLATLTTFFAQEQQAGIWKYVIALSPLALAALLIMLYRIYLRIRSFLQMVTQLKESYDLVTAANLTSQLVVRIVNTEGDIRYERRFRYELIKNNVCVKRTKRDLISSEVPLGKMPPSAKLISSSRTNVCLNPTEHASMDSIRSGRKHFDYRWCYEISPPLTKKGDFLEYEYTAMIPKSEERAFTPDGSVFFFVHEAGLMDIICTLISPPQHRIEIVKYQIEQHDGIVKDLPEGEKPKLEANGNSLTWKPGHRKGATYICRYRLIAA